jgi:hypothetical protein
MSYPNAKWHEISKKFCLHYVAEGFLGKVANAHQFIITFSRVKKKLVARGLIYPHPLAILGLNAV